MPFRPFCDNCENPIVGPAYVSFVQVHGTNTDHRRRLLLCAACETTAYHAAANALMHSEKPKPSKEIQG